MVASRGPAPKRRDALLGHATRDRKEKADVVPGGEVVPPELNLGDDPDELVSEWYEALRRSPQARYLTDADWQRARLTALVMRKFLAAERPNAQLWAGLNASMEALLCSENSRRRLHIEVAQGEGFVPEDDESDHVLKGLMERLSA